MLPQGPSASATAVATPLVPPPAPKHPTRAGANAFPCPTRRSGSLRPGFPVALPASYPPPLVPLALARSCLGDLRFHPGQPIFHEGSKGWSCCTRRVLEFDEFLKIKGCKTGKHRYLDAAANPAAAAVARPVECRLDWYQTPTQVITSFFAKKVNRAESSVQFEENALVVKLVMETGIFEKRYNLFQPIKPAECKFEFLSVKVEVTLRKANGISWATFEKTDAALVSWTTFGIEGRVGTVGAKEYKVAGDAPILATPPSTN